MRGDRRRRRARRGAAIIEMALVLPLFILLIFGQLEMIRLGMVSQLLTSAAREGCRLAVIDGNDPAAVNARVTQALADASIDIARYGTIEILPANWQDVRLSDVNNKITVRLSIPYGRVSWLPTPGYLGNPTLRASATLSSERP